MAILQLTRRSTERRRTDTAPALGDVTGDKVTPTGIVGTPSGNGYYIVKADGGVFSFGDAVFYGSTGGKRPGGHNATGLALSLNAGGDVNGYWMVFEDGRVSFRPWARTTGSSLTEPLQV